MAKTTYPNQRNIKINRERATTDFLGIKNENWQAASRDLGATALRLYLYLASNANGYTIALSPAAIRRDIGMARSTYHDQFHILVDKGYLIPISGNTFEFFERPQPRPVNNIESELLTDGLNFENCPTDDKSIPKDGQAVLKNNIEINNKDFQINNEINIAKTDQQEMNSFFQPKVNVITIQPPTAHGKKRPISNTPATGEFKF